MGAVTSKDGTRIGFDRAGSGPPLILVDGAMCYRGSGPMGPIAKLLASHFTVYTYDRRGRGESTNVLPYSVAREVEDLQALIAEAGGSACVCGLSSGAALAAEAAHQGAPITKLALFEAPFFVDDTRAPLPPDFIPRLEQAVASNERGEAVKMFMKLVGVPAVFIALMRFTPPWKKLTGIAHTLPYDMRIVSEHQWGKPLPRQRWSGATMPTVVIDGGKSPVWMRNAARELAGVLPNARYETLPGQTHMVKASALVPALRNFFAGGA
jgi:pimeloyl-ACP methyl ester carboxylesterase